MTKNQSTRIMVPIQLNRNETNQKREVARLNDNDETCLWGFLQ